VTALLPRRPVVEETWGTMPGWGVVADLTPPELLAARRLKGLKKLIAAALVVVLLLCVGEYLLARQSHGAAQADYEAAVSRTNELTAAAASDKLSAVTRVKTLTASIRTQLGQAAASQVDVAALLNRVGAATPGGVDITSINVSITGATSADTSTIPTLDTSGQTPVGTVTLAGSASDMTSVATFVTKLGSVKGIVDVIPTGNSKGGSGSSGAQWTMTAQLTGALLTRRPAASVSTATTGGN
jgi:Tfp pilus assembly protein PilN